MKNIISTLGLFLILSSAKGQLKDTTIVIDSLIVPEGQSLDIQFLIAEAMVNNPEIRAATDQMDVMEARIPQERALDDPELTYSREEMPDFRWSEAMYARLELSQTIRFPGKLSTQGKLAELRSDHAHHDHLEIVNDVVARLKNAYYELWFIQQNIAFLQENVRLVKQFSSSAQTKYRVGEVTQQDVLKAEVELQKIGNELISYRQKEMSAKTMLMSILNRSAKDTLGFASMPEDVVRLAPLDSLLSSTLTGRPMLIHDSLSIEEHRTERLLAKQEYLPDFRLSLERVTGPATGFQGWSVRAGITIPFAPWTLGKASARVGEADAAIQRSVANYTVSRNMVLASVKDLYYKAEADRQQLRAYRLSIIPHAQQALNASQASYATGRVDFLMLIDSYRTFIDLTREYFMTRMLYEQHVAALEQAVGSQNIVSTK